MLLQGSMLYVTEYLPGGDLYHALADEKLADKLSWYNRWVLAHTDIICMWPWHLQPCSHRGQMAEADGKSLCK